MRNIFTNKVFSFLFAGSMLIAFPFFVRADHTNEHTIEQLQAQISSLFAEITALRDQIASRGGSGEVPSTKVTPVTICPRFSYNFYLGMNDGETEGQITDLQKILAVDSEVYPESLITGYYGPLTEQAVRRYQKKHGIVSSGSPDTTGYGVVGPATRTTLLQRCDQTVMPLPFSLVKISSPNGGESLRLGDETLIQWSSFKPFSYVDIDLLSWGGQPCNKGPCPASAMPGFSAAITRKAPNTGVFSWRVGKILSDSIVPAGAYVMRVSNSENTGVYDQSDSYFKIILNDVPDTNNPPVISGVSGPTSLSVGQVGTWTVKASSLSGGNLSYSVVWGDEVRMSGTGSPSGVPASAQTQQTATFTHSYSQAGIYKPGFYVTNNNESINGSAYASISVNVGGSVVPFITILSPNGGESFLHGSQISIKWKSSETPSYVGLNLLQNGNHIMGIGNVPNTGSYNWIVPTTISGSSFKVRAYGEGVIDESDASFVIAKPSISILSPNGGETWQLKYPHTITWTPDPNSQLVSAYLEKQVNGSFVIVGKIIESSRGSIIWNGDIGREGDYPEPGMYYVRIVNSQTGFEDRSDLPFQIVAAGMVKTDLKINGSDGPISLPTDGGTVAFVWTSSNADSCRLLFNGLATDMNSLPANGERSVFLKKNPYTGQLATAVICSSGIGGASDDVFISAGSSI